MCQSGGGGTVPKASQAGRTGQCQRLAARVLSHRPSPTEPNVLPNHRPSQQQEPTAPEQSVPVPLTPGRFSEAERGCLQEERPSEQQQPGTSPP